MKRNSLNCCYGMCEKVCEYEIIYLNSGKYAHQIYTLNVINSKYYIVNPVCATSPVYSLR